MSRNIIFALALFSILGSLAFAQYGGYGASTTAATGIGTSTILLNQSTLSMRPGQSALVSYTVKLASGNTWGTTISVANASALSLQGIGTSLSNTYADPTYTGTLTVTASAAAKAGNYSISMQATGDDPSSAPALLTLSILAQKNTSTTTIKAAPAVPAFAMYSINTIVVNATKGGTSTVNAPDGVSITAVIPAGTYAKSGNSILASYNFSLSTFTTANVTAPPSNSTYAVAYGFAFEVNKRITTNYTFVNSSGVNRPLTTYAAYPPTWTSWAWLGGTLNGTSYKGGSYAVQNKWTYNSTTGLLTNVQFIKPVMWVFLIAPPSPTTTSASTSVAPSPTTTAPTQSSAPAPSNTLLYAGVAVIIIIIVIAALFLRRKR
jgi:hypothetical protein